MTLMQRPNYICCLIIFEERYADHFSNSHVVVLKLLFTYYVYQTKVQDIPE